MNNSLVHLYMAANEKIGLRDLWQGGVWKFLNNQLQDASDLDCFSMI